MCKLHKLFAFDIDKRQLHNTAYDFKYIFGAGSIAFQLDSLHGLQQALDQDPYGKCSPVYECREYNATTTLLWGPHKKCVSIEKAHRLPMQKT